MKRFDADENQAIAWKSLEKGTHTKEDLTWLKHEKAEQWYEQKNDAGYSSTSWTNMEDENEVH